MSTQPNLSFLFQIILDLIHLLKVCYLDFIIHITTSFKLRILGIDDSAVLSTYFKGKTVLITGASGGLGKALALEVAALSAAGKEVQRTS